MWYNIYYVRSTHINIFGLSIRRKSDVKEVAPAPDARIDEIERQIIEMRKQINRVERKVYRSGDVFNDGDNNHNPVTMAQNSGIDWSKWE